MKLITWNVQWCRGMDGRVDPARIIAEAKAFADFDVLCLQEISDNFPDPRLAGSSGENQFAQLAQLLPNYDAVSGIAVDVPADDDDGLHRRRRFGNMILSRFPVGQIFRHLLPYGVEPDTKGMPRMGLEAVVRAPFGDVRIITTHLEFYGHRNREAQVEDLRRIYAEGSAHARQGRLLEDNGGPFHNYPRPAGTIITGDFNLEPDDPLHAKMVAPFGDGTPLLFDAWKVSHPAQPHPTTFRLWEDPAKPELHCDFIFVSQDLTSRIGRVAVDQETQASDHQPVLVELE